MSPKNSHSTFIHDDDHRSDSPPISPSAYRSRRRSPVRHSGNRAAMQAPPHSYPDDAPQQRNGRGSIVLPPGKNDLEILENLKQIIKSGQHEFYRAIPQPAALASLYLGKIPTSELANKSAGDTQATPVVQDVLPKDPVSPAELVTRSPRLKGNESWESGSSRLASMSKVEEQAVVANGYLNHASEGLPTPSTAAPPSVSGFIPPSLSTPAADDTPPDDSTLTPSCDFRPHTRDRTDMVPASDDSSTAVAVSPAKVVSSPVSQFDAQDRDPNYSSRIQSNDFTQPEPYSRDDKRQEYPGGRYRKDSFSRSNNRYPVRNSGDNWRSHPQQRPYKQNYDTTSRSYVKTEEVPISLSDLDSRPADLSTRDLLPPVGSGSASSQIPSRSGNGIQSTERSFLDTTVPVSADTHGLPPGLSSTAHPSGQYNPGRPGYDVAVPNAIKSEPAPPFHRDTRVDGPLSSASIDQNGRPGPAPSDSSRMHPYKDNTRFAARPFNKYNRPGSPGHGGAHSRPPIDRDDNRGPPRDYRPQHAPPKPISRERDYRPPPSNNPRPGYDDRRVERIDVDDDHPYSDQRQYRGFSPPTPAEMARDKQRQTQHRFPPSPRAGTSELPYEPPSPRRYSGPPPPPSVNGPPPPHSASQRKWYAPPSVQPAGSYHPQRWEEEPYYPPRDRPANWDAPADRGRYEPETPPRRWEDRSDRDSRDPYRGPPPPSAPANDRYVDRGRPPAAAPTHGPPPSYSRVRPRSPSPIRADSRPPMKRQRDDYPGPPPPPPSSGDYYSPHAPALPLRDSVRGRPSGDAYHSSGGGRGVSPMRPPPSGSSGFYDRPGPPPSTSSSAMSVDRDRVGDRGSDQDRGRPPPRDFMPPPPPRHRDSVEEYHPHTPSIPQGNGPLYERPRSPPGGRPSMPSSVSGALRGRVPSGPGGGGYRGGYRAPLRDRGGYMNPPSRP